MSKYVVVVGGVNIDIKAKTYESLIMRDSNPGTVSFSSGGVGRNIAHNLALMKVDVKLISAVGNDQQGKQVLEETEKAGVNTDYTAIIENVNTGTYIALLNNSGEMEAAVSSMDILSYVTPEFLSQRLEVISNSSFIICDTNISAESIKYLMDISSKFNIPICIEPVSVTKAKKLKDILGKATIITPNRDELMELSGSCSNSDIAEASKKLVFKGVEYVITTLGPEGLCITDINESKILKSYKTNVVDVTGAGDSLTAGLIYGMLKYDDINKACLCGLAAASITVSSKDTVSQSINEANLNNIVNTV